MEEEDELYRKHGHQILWNPFSMCDAAYLEERKKEGNLAKFTL